MTYLELLRQKKQSETHPSRTGETGKTPLLGLHGSVPAGKRSLLPECGAGGAALLLVPAPVPGTAGAAIAEVVLRLQPVPPCPATVAERAAIMAKGDHCDRMTADTRALAEHGLPSWPALADAHRERILGQLTRLPPASSDHGRRLHGFTRRFLDTEHWRSVVALGWDLVEVFGIHAHAPLARTDSWGLVPLLALSMRIGARLEWVEPALAGIRTGSGVLRPYLVGLPAMDEAVLWWECTAIFGDCDIQPNRENA